MAILEERRRALEDKYILDFERSFKTRARRNQMFARWVATLLGKADADAYVDEVAALSVRSPDDDSLISKTMHDLQSAGRPADERQIREKLHEMMFSAADSLDREDTAVNGLS